MDLEPTSSASSVSSTASADSTSKTARAIENARNEKVAKMKEDRRRQEQRQVEQVRREKEFAAQREREAAEREREAEQTRRQQMLQQQLDEAQTMDIAQAEEPLADDLLLDMDDLSTVSDHDSFGACFASSIESRSLMLESCNSRRQPTDSTRPPFAIDRSAEQELRGGADDCAGHVRPHTAAEYRQLSSYNTESVDACVRQAARRAGGLEEIGT
jgi:hypothetical protein